MNISVSYYAPKLCLSGSLSQTVSGSNFLSQRVSRCNFLLLLCVPKGPNSLFCSWFAPFCVLAWRQHEPQFDKGEKWLAATVFFPQSTLLHSHVFHYFLALLVTHSQSASLCSPFLSSVLFVSLPPYLSDCPIVLGPLSSPFLLFSLYSLNISCVCPPPSTSCSRTVLHRQFSKSATHSPFSPQALNTIFKHKSPKVEKA